MIKKIAKRLATFFTVMALAVTSSFSAFAADANSNNGFASNGDVVTIIDPNAAMPMTYLDPPTFTFTDSNRGELRNLSGRYMAFEVKLNNCTCDYVQICLYIDDLYVGAYNFGKNSSGKVDWIDMGSDREHDIRFTYFTKPSGKATVTMTMYSWT